MTFLKRSFYCFDSQSKDVVDPVMLWTAIFDVFCVSGSLFLACEIGQRLTDLFEDINEQLEGLNWYLFPLKMQQLLPILLINAQEEVVIGCYGAINCSRVQCQKVNNSIWTCAFDEYSEFISFVSGGQCRVQVLQCTSYNVQLNLNLFHMKLLFAMN